MADSDNSPPRLPVHIEETIRQTALLHAEHRENATVPQRAAGRITALLARPALTITLTGIVIGWISLNLFIPVIGYRAFDPPPFSFLAGAISLISFYVVVLILATQRHEDELAQQREQLILGLAISSEQKTGKVIELLEELRRDTPIVHDRIDKEAEDMARRADPGTVMNTIKETHR